MNFSTKFKILKHILKSEKMNEPKGFFNAIHVIMNKRNIIAHSDSLLNFELDVSVDCDWSYDDSFMYPIWSLELSLPIIENEEIKYQNISKIVKDFSKHFRIAKDGLKEIDSKLFAVIV